MGNFKKGFDVKRIQSLVPFESKASKLVMVNDNVVDVKDVSIMGYASTFAHITPQDRIGDVILPGAFRETIGAYLKNPVILADHDNNTQSVVGKTVNIQEDQNGLLIEGKLSNAPDVQSIRMKVAEGILKALSIGGFFHYADDGKSIYKVDLFEYSIVGIPMNPDALFVSRSLDLDDMSLLLKRTTSRNELENIAQSIKDGRVVNNNISEKAIDLFNIKKSVDINGVSIDY